jgi:hypothetical protein
VLPQEPIDLAALISASWSEYRFSKGNLTANPMGRQAGRKPVECYFAEVTITRLHANAAA